MYSHYAYINYQGMYNSNRITEMIYAASRVCSQAHYKPFNRLGST